ncbi:MAG: hypothetical protein ACLFR2_01225 [Candidatus Kapaibacterium sp.]
MENLTEFATGPLFRLSIAIMLLGLARALYLAIAGGLEAKRKAADKELPKSFVTRLTFGYMLPLRALRMKPFYSIISIIFHAGLIVTPIFLYDHVHLIYSSIGIAWLGLTLPKQAADILTLVTILAGIMLLVLRASGKESRFLSRPQDYWLLILLIIPFVSGYVCSNFIITPGAYDAFFLIHVLSGNLIFILLPFTKLVHSVLLPLSQWITARSWKFDPQGPENAAVVISREGDKS